MWLLPRVPLLAGVLGRRSILLLLLLLLLMALPLPLALPLTLPLSLPLHLSLPLPLPRLPLPHLAVHLRVLHPIRRHLHRVLGPSAPGPAFRLDE